jgi:hypothetical protein
VTVYGLQKVCFDPYKSEKNTFVGMTLILVWCHVSPKTVNVQVIHVWRHVSKITTQGWCICEIDSRRQVSLQEVSPDYDQSALEQSAIYFVIVTSGHDVHQSVQFYCPGTVHLDWNNIPQAVFNTLIRPIRRRCQCKWWTHMLLTLLMSKRPLCCSKHLPSDVKCYSSNCLMKNAWFSN